MTRYAIVTWAFPFEASPGHRSNCQRPHGQANPLQMALHGLVISALEPSDVDTEDLKQRVKRLLFTAVPCGGLKQNDSNRFPSIRTTAPNLVHWIWDALVVAGVPDHLLHCIRRWEKECLETTHKARETVYNGFEQSQQGLRKG